MHDRTAVIVRDPRNVVLSEQRMRVEAYRDEVAIGMSLDDFVRWRFEVGDTYYWACALLGVRRCSRGFASQTLDSAQALR